MYFVVRCFDLTLSVISINKVEFNFELIFNTFTIQSYTNSTIHTIHYTVYVLAYLGWGRPYVSVVYCT